MPTIDQLAPAFAAADTDELLINQNGVARKISRALLLAGLQPQIAVESGTLLGNPGPDFSAPSQITLGENLVLQGTTLSATASPYVVADLPQGTVPAGTDIIPVGQRGANAAVTYAQFMTGLSGMTNVDVSKLSVTSTGSSASYNIGDLAASTVLTTGAAMTGPLLLPGNPSQPLHAATKQYVDAGDAASLPINGGVLTGPLTLSGSPTMSSHAASKQYVDSQAANFLPISGGTLAGTLTLAGDPANLMQATTRRYTDAGDANNALAIAAEASARAAALGALQTTVVSTQSAVTSASANAAAAQTAASMALGNANAAQTTAATAASNATAAQSLAGAALPLAGGTMTGDLLTAANRVYAGTNDFAAVRVQGLPSDGKAMLYVNKVGSSGTDPNLLASVLLRERHGGHRRTPARQQLPS